jgi:hypothetical protein
VGAGCHESFAAQDLFPGARVVVKVVSPELSSGVNLERFRREILLAAQLQHPHIVPVLAAGEVDGLPYFIMPFVSGHSLRQRLDGTHPLPVPEVVSILRTWRGPWPTPIVFTSCIATSSRRTCCSPADPRPSPTSASQRRSPPPARLGEPISPRAGPPWHASLHGAGAGSGRSQHRPPRRSLFFRYPRLRAAFRRSPFHGRPPQPCSRLIWRKHRRRSSPWHPTSRRRCPGW